MNTTSPTGLVPVVVIDDAAASAVPLAELMMHLGVSHIEVTLRTPAAFEALTRMRRVPGITVGAGTVIGADAVFRAVNAGAQFLVCPGLDSGTIEAAADAGVPMVPGVCTPSEVLAAVNMGIDYVKFFPAEPAGGLPFLRSLAEVFSSVTFMPTGGIRSDLVSSYLELPSVAAVGASWLAPRALTARRDFPAIEKIVASALKEAEMTHV